MNQTRPSEIDAVIDAVLGGEPLRPMPSGLHHRIAARVRVAALLEQERRRFRECIAGCAAAVLMGFCGLILLAFLAGVPGLIRHGTPGCLGHLDYLHASVSIHMSSLRSAVTLTSPSVIAAATAMALVPLGGLLAHHALRRIR